MTTIQEVAQAAGVSISTVSRVVNQPALVNERTRARVSQVIERLEYRPNRVARRLRVERGGSRLIGLIIPDIQNPFFADLARGVEDLAEAHGYAVFLGNSDEDAGKERRYLEVMRAESVDGVILPPSSEASPGAMELAKSKLPMVCVDRRLSRVAVDTVLIDNVRGAFDATEHLLELGHRRIGFIAGRRQLSTSRERLQGYREALADRGLELDPSLVRDGESRQAIGRRAALELIEMEDRPSALVVSNSLMALGALEVIRVSGLRIPHDIALVSYDDVPWALAFDPPITVVRQPAYELGRRAMELLLQRLAEPARSTTLVMLHPELVVRTSCGAAAA